MARDPALAFLPAALAVEHTAPLPAARGILWSVIALCAGAALWASCGRVDIVSVAEGRIVPSARVKPIQPLMPAAIRAINVGEGQRVTAGQLLIELDDTLASADRARLRGERIAMEREHARLAALLARLDGAPTVALPQPALALRVAQEFDAYLGEQRALGDERARIAAERATTLERIAALRATLPLIGERAGALAALESRALAPRSAWLELEQERVAQAREAAVLTATLEISDASQAMLISRGAALEAATRTRWLAELAVLDERLAANEQALIKAARVCAEHRLRAPVAGTVQQLAVLAVGGVVSPAQQLMLIVPDEAALEIEAWLPNREVGFVHAGQAARVKVETFPFTRYGTLAATVSAVSRDAIADERRGLIYRLAVHLGRQAAGGDKPRMQLQPGMAVTIEVMHGRRRIIDFLLAPLLRYRDEGLRER